MWKICLEGLELEVLEGDAISLELSLGLTALSSGEINSENEPFEDALEDVYNCSAVVFIEVVLFFCKASKIFSNYSWLKERKAMFSFTKYSIVCSL